LRFNRFDVVRLVIVIGLSLAMHLVAYGGYQFGKDLHLFSWLRWLSQLRPAPVVVPHQDQSLEFAMDRESPVAPERAKRYGPKNSVAADPTHGDQNDAKIDGKQTEVAKTETTARTDPNQLQPQALPQAAHPLVAPGDLALGKAQEPQQQVHPQKLSQVKPASLPGLKMLQPGGAKRPSLVPSLDVKASPYGVYDQKFIEAVTQRWYDQLDSQQFALDRQGKVVLRFHLNYDGSISDMTVLQNTVGELLGHVCENAVHDPSPFEAWPSEMRRLVGGTYREITFTFYYY